MKIPPETQVVVLVAQDFDKALSAITEIRIADPRIPIYLLEFGIHPEATDILMRKSGVQVISPNPTWKWDYRCERWYRSKLQSFDAAQYARLGCSRAAAKGQHACLLLDDASDLEQEYPGTLLHSAVV